MKSPLNLLLLEDSEADALTLLEELSLGGYKVSCERIHSAAEFRAALERGPWDLILSDYAMPQFDGLTALAILNASRKDIPFIMVSGHVGAEQAVRAMREGVADFINKDNLSRLVPAIERELHKLQLRERNKQAEAALKESEERYRLLVERMPDAILVHCDRRIEFVNPAAVRLLGADTPGKLLGKPVMEIVHSDFLAIVEERIRQTLARGNTQPRELKILRLDGTAVEVESTSIPFAQGGKRGVQVIFHDIDERKRAQAEQARLARQMELLLQSTGEGIWGMDLEGRCTFINKAGAEMLGCAPEAVLGRNMHELTHHHRADGSPYPMDECPIFHAFQKGRRCRMDTEVFWRMDGTSFPVEYSSFPIIDAGTITGAVVTFSDISKRRVTEEQLRQAQKMESIGHLAGGIAHDFNNILTVIQGHAALLKNFDLKSPDHADSLREILLAAERAANLTRQLLMFSRKQVMQLRNINLNEVVKNMSKMLARVLGENISLHFEYSANEPLIHADIGMMEQVLMNLSVNSRDAMPDGGRLIIHTNNTVVDEALAARHPEASPGRYVRLSVSDTGIGIPAENLPRIFEPFFTTKGLGQGTGLGLPTVLSIVQQHRGWIQVESETNRGTTFSIYLPRPSARKLEAGSGNEKVS